MHNQLDNLKTQAATRRSWHEDALVLGLLFAIAMASAVILAPQGPATVSTPVPIAIAAVEPAVSPPPRVAAPEIIEPAQIDDLPIPDDQLLPSGEAFITLFGDGHPARTWYHADRKVDKGFWRNDFRPENIALTSEGLALSVTEKPQKSGQPWTAGEISTKQKFGYGRYEAVMKPAKGSGLVSSFFTYTGPYFGDPQDEIDIEFLGKNTRQVEFNTFRKGVSNGAKIVELPFDAAEAFHLYAFEWRPYEVIWFIDGAVAHRSSLEDHPLPATPGYLMMNIWTGKLTGWHGPATFQSGAAAEFACVSYRPIGAPARSCSTYFAPPPVKRLMAEARTLLD